MDDDRGHLITLPLAAEVGAESLLEELQSTLILGHTQQLHGSSLVGSKADDLANDAADELVVLGDGLGRGKAQIRIWKQAKGRQKIESTYTLLAGWSVLVAVVLGHLVALVHADHRLVTGIRHFSLGVESAG